MGRKKIDNKCGAQSTMAKHGSSIHISPFPFNLGNCFEDIDQMHWTVVYVSISFNSLSTYQVFRMLYVGLWGLERNMYNRYDLLHQSSLQIGLV